MCPSPHLPGWHGSRNHPEICARARRQYQILHIGIGESPERLEIRNNAQVAEARNVFRLKQLENEGDVAYQEAVASLFREETRPIEVPGYLTHDLTQHALGFLHSTIAMMLGSTSF